MVLGPREVRGELGENVLLRTAELQPLVFVYFRCKIKVLPAKNFCCIFVQETYCDDLLEFEMFCFGPLTFNC